MIRISVLFFFVLLNFRSAFIAHDLVRAGLEEQQQNAPNKTAKLLNIRHMSTNISQHLLHLQLRNSNSSDFQQFDHIKSHLSLFGLNRTNETWASLTRIVLDLNKYHAFWRNGQTRFCNVIRHATNVTIIGVDKPYHVLYNLPPPLLRVTFDCADITKNTDLGTGNWITAIYAIRMAAALGMVDLEVKCQGGMENDLDHLISWFTGYYPSPTQHQDWPYDGPIPTEKTVCNHKVAKLRIDHMAHAMQSDLRKLAVTVLGTRRELGWIHPFVPENQPPLVPNVTLDETVIHFRCGDIIGGYTGNDYGFLHFSEYTKFISSHNTKTLGIVTQPFTKGKSPRKKGVGNGKRCQQVVTALVDYLQDYLPNTTIQIRNDAKEPLAVTYARMVLSKQVFVGYSTFGIFPVVGTFGEGYFQKGNNGVNPWANYIPDKLPNLHMMDAARMGSQQIQNAGLKATLRWLVSPVQKDAQTLLSDRGGLQV